MASFNLLSIFFMPARKQTITRSSHLHRTQHSLLNLSEKIKNTRPVKGRVL